MVPSWRSFRKKVMSCFNIAVISLLISSLQPVEGFAITNGGGLGLFQISEEQPIGTVVFTVITDQPADSFEMTDAGGYFGINSTTGEVFIQKRIDKEVIGSSRLTATVTARKDSLTATANLRCVVNDINDVTPSFPKRFYNVLISEKTSVDNVAYALKAEDADIGNNGQQFVTYEITSGNEDGSFSITQYGGEVKVSRDLDYETKTQYTLNITARDKPGLSNWTILQVTVLDADDLPAKFTSFIYKAEVSEDALLGTSILQVVAFDLDKYINGSVTYGMDQVTNPSRLFVINNVTGLISLNGFLDRESVAEYSIRVLAYSSYPFTDHATVNIKVTDANDNRPIFTQSVYQGSVVENLAAGASVLKVKATDKDQGINAELRYHINPGNDANRFSINHQTGVVTTAAELDREEKNLYNVAVVVEDMNGNRAMGNVLNKTATVYIHVKDANDNAPVFTFPSYNVTINESIAVGAKVSQVEAKDPDVDQDIMYAITGGNDLSRFLIGRRSGIIYVRSVIDRDPPRNETAFTLEVIAIDAKNHLLNSTTTVTVAVHDVNDSPPHCSQAVLTTKGAKFEKNLYETTLVKDSTPGTVMMTVQAKDADCFNATVEYKIYQETNPGNVYKVNNNTGEITVNGPLTIGTQLLVVTATSTKNPPAFTVVNITVAAMLNMSYTVAEGLSNVVILNLEPAEQYYNVTVGTFSIISSAQSSLFSIDGKNLKVGGVALDRETRDQYQLNIALDKGGTRKGVVMERHNEELSVFSHTTDEQNVIPAPKEQSDAPGTAFVTQQSSMDADYELPDRQSLNTNQPAPAPDTYQALDVTSPGDLSTLYHAYEPLHFGDSMT